MKKKDPSEKKSKSRLLTLKFYTNFLKRNLRIIVLMILLVASLNILVNQKFFQEQMIDIVHKRTKLAIDFDKLHINIFTGTISGRDIELLFKKTNLQISLSEFKIRFNPLNFFTGRIDIESIQADKIFIDISDIQKNKNKNDKATKVPSFLTRIELSQAKVNEIFINRGEKGFYSAKNIVLSSKLGSFFSTSPLTLKLEDVRVFTPKVQLNNKELTLEGYFTIDLSNPRLLNESRLKSKMNAKGLLLAIQKKPKPWLENPAWDKDLENVIKQFYTLPLPKDRTFLYIQETQFNITKNLQDFAIDTLQIKLADGLLVGSGEWSLKSKDLKLNLATKTPIPISKLPLGQAQFRTAFDSLTAKLDVKGKISTLQKNNLAINLSGKLLGNNVNPIAGAISVTTNGQIVNSNFQINQILAMQNNGKITGSGNIDILNLTSQLNFSCQDFDAQTVIRFFSTLNFPSLVNCDGSLKGDLKDPNININLSTNNAAYQFLNFGKASGNLKIAKHNLNLTAQSQNSEIGQSNIDLKIENVFKPFDQIVTMKTAFQNLKVGKAISSQNIDGLASGEFNLKRIKNINSGDGQVKVTQIKILEKDYGELETSILLKDKHITLKPIQSKLFSKQKVITSARGLEFDFDDYGFQFSGYPVDGLFVKGSYLKSNDSLLNIDLDAKNMDLFLLEPFIPLEITSSKLSGKFSTQYNIKAPLLSSAKGKITTLEIISAEGNFYLNKPSQISYNNKSIYFNNFDIRHGRGVAKLNGPLSLENASSFKITGTLDFNAISELNPFITFSEKIIPVDLLIKGNIYSPLIYGKVTLTNDTLEFRKILSDFEDLSGTLTFDGNKISTQNFTFLYDDSDMIVSGWIKTNYEFITDANLKLVGREVPVHMENGIDLIADIDLSILGANQNLKIEGDLNIVEGQYSQDYGITNFIVKPKTNSLEEEDENRWAMLPINTKLNIKVKNPGEFLIKNNMANLDLNIGLDIFGTLKVPLLSGQVDILSGSINTLGIFFEDASGYAQFRRDPEINPQISIKAQTEVGDYVIIVQGTGTLENLRLDFESNPTLDRKDIMSLLFYGQTSDQLVNNAQQEFLQTAAIAQLASVLSQPISKYSGLDFFSVSQRQESSQETIQRLAFGKKITSRFNVAFTTDINNNEDPERAIEIEFLVFDAFSLIFAKDFGDRYRFDLNFKFESY